MFDRPTVNGFIDLLPIETNNMIERLCAETPAPRILIVGSLYLAGQVLARHSGEAMSQVTGAGRR